ncbi:MAG: hypothetical protein IPP83_07260 [Flavobacteriales bacterium]|nr:hypothetical protein [Flavobacteriales bacterium]
MTTTVIAIWGSAQQGKTSTLRRTIERLETHYGVTASVVGPTGQPDVTAVLDTRWGRIGVTTKGDPTTNPYLRVENLADAENCKVILCSTRTRGDTVNDLDALCNTRGWRLLWWSNISGAQPHPAWNDLSAKYIVDLVETIMIGQQ